MEDSPPSIAPPPTPQPKTGAVVGAPGCIYPVEFGLLSGDLNYSLVSYLSPECLFSLPLKSFHLLPHSDLFLSDNGVRRRYYCNDFASHLPELVDWNWFLQHYTVDPLLLSLNWSRFNPSHVWRHQPIRLPLLREQHFTVDWDLVSLRPLTPDILSQYANRIDWHAHCQAQQLPESLLVKYRSRCPAGVVSRYQRLSEAFIRKYYIWLDMALVSRYQCMSFSFLREMSPHLSFPNLAKNLNYILPGGIQVLTDGDGWFIIDAPVPSPPPSPDPSDDGPSIAITPPPVYFCSRLS